MNTNLWCIHIPGPDEVYAAPSEAAARHMAEQHNTSMRAYFEKYPEVSDFGPRQESCMATAVVYPWSAEDHAEALVDFKAAEWGWSEGGAV